MPKLSVFGEKKEVCDLRNETTDLGSDPPLEPRTHRAPLLRTAPLRVEMVDDDRISTDDDAGDVLRILQDDVLGGQVAVREALVEIDHDVHAVIDDLLRESRSDSQMLCDRKAVRDSHEERLLGNELSARLRNRAVRAVHASEHVVFRLLVSGLVLLRADVLHPRQMKHRPVSPAPQPILRWLFERYLELFCVHSPSLKTRLP